MMRVLKALMISAILMLPGGTSLADTPDTGQITVTGEGSVEGAPDIAVLSLGVTTEAATAAEAMAANTAAMAALLERLRSAGIAERDLQTANLSLNPNWTGYDGKSPPEITGYAAVNQLTVRIRALDTLGSVLDTAISDGANTLNGLSFGLTDPRLGMDRARVAAVADARAKAELLVQAAGVGLGRIVSISESGGYAQPAQMMKSSLASDSAIPVAGGEVSTAASVTMVFEITQ
jgi:uncharacterized protein YggE